MPPPPTVLLVDDSADLLEAYDEILKAVGYNVVTAPSVDAAIAAIQAQRPDLVLTDIVMPDRSGLELITWIRSDLAPPLPPIIALSGFPDVRPEALRRGASVFQAKPLDAPELIELVASGLEGRLDEVAPKIAAESQERREAVARSAETSIAETLARHPDLIDQVRGSVAILSRYFDGDIVVLLLLVEGHAQILCSSHPQDFPEGSLADEILGRVVDVIVSRSSLVVSSAQLATALGADSRLGWQTLASAPLIFEDGTVLGSVAVFGDRAAHLLDGADLRILERLTRYGSVAFTDVGSRPLVHAPYMHLLRREHWQFVLQQELAHAGGDKCVGLALVETTKQPMPAAIERVQRALPGRTALGHFANRRFAVFRLASADAVRRSLIETVVALDEVGGAGRAAIVLFENVLPPQDVGSIFGILAANLPEKEDRGIVSVVTVRGEQLSPAALRHAMSKP